MNGGELVARVLERHGVRYLFTLCGGHISPILVEAKKRGIRVVDVRDEASAVFAADAVARLTGVPGVAAVTAGPGATNTITAVKNAQLAHSPVVVLGGAAATILEGRGALQDIDQMALMGPHVKWAVSASKVRELPEILTEALAVASGQTSHPVPGPVFVECPVDLLYDREMVLEFYGAKGGGKGLSGKLVGWYLKRHAKGLFRGASKAKVPEPETIEVPVPSSGETAKAAKLLAGAERPLLVVGAQGVSEAREVQTVAEAVEALGVPVYLASGARGLLGRGNPLQLFHERRKALKEADLVVLAGFPADFRLDYGRGIPKKTKLVGVNRSGEELELNRRPDLGVEADPGSFLKALAEEVGKRARVDKEGPLGRRRERWAGWRETLAERDAAREAEIAGQAAEDVGGINPLALFRDIEAAMDEESVLVVDGGDFVATASYVLRPRRPLAWLDPGAFGTLGVGGGFALAAKLVRPSAEVWLVWGDGSSAYSLAEIDTMVRHGLPVVAVIGNDAAWTQIAREQVPILGDAVGTELLHTAYWKVAEGYGGEGILVERPEQVPEALRRAKELARQGRPVVLDVHIKPTDFRKGSLSM